MIYQWNGVFLVLVLYSFVSGHVVNAHIIRTRLGALEGMKKEARNGKFFYAYYGIPYAQPPIGRLRFEPPVEMKPWTGVFNATKLLIYCPQFSAAVSTQFLGEEDCLSVNVFTPAIRIHLGYDEIWNTFEQNVGRSAMLVQGLHHNNYTCSETLAEPLGKTRRGVPLILTGYEDAKPGTNIPVLFYIFGGEFDHGHATNYGPEYLLSRDIILVLVSYRLGALGFLSTGDDVISGNMGLRDQTMAMKWTKENIYDFGGDPRRVTIHGHSSGSMSVHAHTLSPLSRDYFDQAIMQSGFVAPNMIWDRDFASTIALNLGRLVKCPIESTKVLKNCLQSRSAKELVLAAQKLNLWKKLAPKSFFPVIEDDSVTNAFLNKSNFLGPYSTFSKPWLLGLTTGEAAIYANCVTPIAYFHPDSSSINMDPKLLFPLIGKFVWSSKMNQVDFIVRWLKTRFFGEEEVNNATNIADIALVKMLNGILFGRQIIDVIQNYAGPKYVYLMDFRYVGGYTHSKGGRGGRYLGLSHGDELPLIFKVKNSAGVADEDFVFGEEIITRWVNFAYSGNPDRPFAINTSVFGAWATVSSPRIEFLRITRHGAMEKDYFLEEYAMYRRIPMFSKYFAE